MVESERRQHPRVPVQIDVAYDNDVFLVNATLQDLSVGGAHILTDAPLPVGTRLSLFFRSDETPFDLSARVSRVTEEDPDEPEVAPSMGVQFLDISSTEQKTLHSLIERYLQQAPEPIEEAVEEALEETLLEETGELSSPGVASLALSEGASPEEAPAESPEDLESTVEYTRVLSQEPAREPQPVAEEVVSRPSSSSLLVDAPPVATKAAPLSSEGAEGEIRAEPGGAAIEVLPDPFATVQISPDQVIDDLTTMRMETSPFTPPSEGIFSPEETITTMPDLPAVKVEEEKAPTPPPEKRSTRRRKKRS